MSGSLKGWLWAAVALAIGGALLLFPIGGAMENTLFVIVKICMVTGLLVMLIGRKMGGFYLWAIASVGAIVMTCIKWSILGSASFLIVFSMIVDFGMPIGAWLLMRRHPLT